MAEHTPGPWRVDATKALGAYGVWAEPLDDADGETQVCSVLTISFRNTDHKDRREVRDANARLIAAAPCLLSALKAMVSVAKSSPRAIGFDSTVYDMANAAIEKASGA